MCPWNRLRQSMRATAQENVRKYFRHVMQKHQLPSLPVVVMKVLEMFQDPDLDVRALCRILSDDAPPAGTVMTQFCCGSAESLEQLRQEVILAYDEESALFRAR
jgi:hypothetical protein